MKLLETIAMLVFFLATASLLSQVPIIVWIVCVPLFILLGILNVKR